MRNELTDSIPDIFLDVLTPARRVYTIITQDLSVNGVILSQENPPT